ncbi:MAG: hypothetical protein ACTSQI_08975 [Candidatus Helarchaeota archaeon]
MPDNPYERHAQIVKEEMISEMDLGLDHIQKLISHMYGGVAGWFLNPFARMIYHIMARKDIREKAIAQIDIVLDCAMKYNGNNLDALVEENIEEYLFNDQSFHRCRKTHKAYPLIEGIMKEVFKSRIEPAHRLVTSEGCCYEELTQNAFSEKQQALDNLKRELEFSYEVLNIIRNNKKVMKIPSFIRDKIIHIMELGQKYAKERLTQRVHEIYEFNGHD